ncbi:MAG: ATP-binding protein [Paracoccaceae bacterium]
MNSFKISFVATEDKTREGLSDIMAALKKADLTAEKQGDVEISVAEAVNNVVEHAYAGLPPAMVQVSGQWNRDQLSVEILDSGHRFVAGRVPVAQQAAVDVPLDDLPEGGFGWFLIHQLTSSVSYTHKDGNNVLTLGFTLSKIV